MPKNMANTFRVLVRAVRELAVYCYEYVYVELLLGKPHYVFLRIRRDQSGLLELRKMVSNRSMQPLTETERESIRRYYNKRINS